MRGPKVFFLIDDDPDDQFIFQMALNDISQTIECRTADNGVTALEQLHKPTISRPDFIFLDLNMPLMNGKECLKEIRKSIKLQSIPVVIYTTSSDPQEIEACLRLGADHFVTKPTSISKLADILCRFLNIRDQQAVAL